MKLFLSFQELLSNITALTSDLEQVEREIRFLPHSHAGKEPFNTALSMLFDRWDTLRMQATSKQSTIEVKMLSLLFYTTSSCDYCLGVIKAQLSFFVVLCRNLLFNTALAVVFALLSRAVRTLLIDFLLWVRFTAGADHIHVYFG